jgi:hypothetical protein
MTRRAADPHLRFDQWLLAGARGEPPRDLALHASLCTACTARISALDMLAAVDPGRAAQPPSLANARRPVMALRRAGRFAAALAGATLVVALVGLAGWRLVELRGLAERVDANASETPGQAVLGGTGESAETASPEGSVASSTEAAATATASPTQTAGATAQPAPPPVTRPVATARPATPRPSASASPSPSPAPSASATPTPAGSATPAPSGPETPTPSPTTTPTATATPTPEPTPTPSP